MSRLIILLIISFFIDANVLAKTLDQKKSELKKVYEAGGISKTEYKKGIEFLENSDENEKEKTKQSFSLKKKKKNKNKINLFGEDEDLEKITSKKIEELGDPVKYDNSYFPEGMIKKFRGCNNSFKCKGDKAGRILYETFKKRKQYQQKYPGEMIKAMAMYEVFFASKLWEDRKVLERYKKNNYKDLRKLKKKGDEKKIRSLIGMNKGKKTMREALGLTIETPTKEVIKKFWLLGEFLELGKGVKNEKLAKDLKERQKLLEDYKKQIANLKKKLKEDIDDDEEDEKSVE